MKATAERNGHGPAMAEGFVPDAAQMEQLLARLFSPGTDLVEVRSIPDGKSGVLSRTAPAEGIGDLVKIATAWNRKGRNVFFSLNPIRSDYRDRAGEAPKDADVPRRRRMMIDFDAIKDDPKGPATAERAEAAFQGGVTVCKELFLGFGFPEPIANFSGNGGQFYYEIDLPNDDGSYKLLDRFYGALRELFPPDAIGANIDPSVKNASRVGRLPGSMNFKANARPDLPNRPACLKSWPPAGSVVAIDMMREVITFAEQSRPQASEAKPPPKPKGASNRGATNDEAYIRAALAGELEKIRGEKPGFQHNRIRAAATALGGFLHLGVVPRAEIEAALYDAALKLGETEKRAREVVRWGLDRGETLPRPLPEARGNGGNVGGGKGAPPGQAEPNGPSPAESNGWVIDARKASSYKIRPVKYLSRPRLPRGMLVLIAGAGGLGKSTLMEDTAARGSTGRPMLGAAEAHVGPFDVLILANEDGKEDALIPRLVAAGADLDRVEIIEGLKNDRGDRIPFDITYIDYLREHVEKGRAAGRDYRLITIDPITTYVGRAKIDDHRDAQLKPALEALALMAQDLDLTFICSAHLNKSTGTHSAALRVMGGAAYVTSSRVAYIYAEDPDDDTRRILASPKCNIPGGKPPALAITIVPIDPAEGMGLIRPHTDHLSDEDRGELVGQLFRLQYEGDVSRTADELLRPASEKPAPDHIEKAATWLAERLKTGSAGSMLVARQGDEHLGLLWPAADEPKNKPGMARQIRIKWWREQVLKKHLDGVSRKLGLQGWYFTLPGQLWPPSLTAIAEAKAEADEDSGQGGEVDPFANDRTDY